MTATEEPPVEETNLNEDDAVLFTVYFNPIDGSTLSKWRRAKRVEDPGAYALVPDLYDAVAQFNTETAVKRNGMVALAAMLVSEELRTGDAVDQIVQRALRGEPIPPMMVFRYRPDSRTPVIVTAQERQFQSIRDRVQNDGGDVLEANRTAFVETHQCFTAAEAATSLDEARRMSVADLEAFKAE
ncbi:hypothetical protein [Leifsonia sp. Leaf264]|uniref:hypothetical protein n=1 Tax=Leifsonia sp. Leaf264 TaxID=1736314 RepID=UPI0006FD1C6A|nr:hypothetical protein [Leifsonia sp. Leaf264]KQO98481.1 hypothetical protein ASF30_10490 [Leifsonia sp. Leaf264]